MSADTVTLRRYRISLSCGIDGGANGAKPFRKDTLGNFGGFHVGFRKTKKGLHRSPFDVREHKKDCIAVLFMFTNISRSR